MSTKLILKKKLKNIIGKQKDNREIHDLLNVDVDQINVSLYGAVKQLIRIVEKQNSFVSLLF